MLSVPRTDICVNRRCTFSLLISVRQPPLYSCAISVVADTKVGCALEMDMMRRTTWGPKLAVLACLCFLPRLSTATGQECNVCCMDVLRLL